VVLAQGLEPSSSPPSTAPPSREKPGLGWEHVFWVGGTVCFVLFLYPVITPLPTITSSQSFTQELLFLIWPYSRWEGRASSSLLTRAHSSDCRWQSTDIVPFISTVGYSSCPMWTYANWGWT